jgi:hypothetical protein
MPLADPVSPLAQQPCPRAAGELRYSRMSQLTLEFPPIFPLGFHRLRLADVENSCVTNFPLSTSRRHIMAGLRTLAERLINDAIEGELWINGSFTTKKIDPKDVDVVLHSPAQVYNNGSPEYRDTVDWINSNLKAALMCDSYVLFHYPANDPLYEEGKWWYSYWHVKWGFSRGEDPKGIVLIDLDRGVL